MKFHPLAELFPLIEGAEFDDLVASIREHGLREEITLHDDMILDGRNRYRACEVAGVEPRFETFDGDDLYSFVCDKNVHRRHLNPSQLGLIAARMATLKLGDNQYTVREGSSPELPSSQSEKTKDIPTVKKMADLMNIGQATLKRARVVLNEGTPEEIRAIEAGRATVNAIADQIIKARGTSRTRIVPDKAEARQAQKQRNNALLWGKLRDAIENISDLPRPDELVRIATFSDKGGLLNRRLSPSLQWLREFHDAWNAKDQVKDRVDQSDTGDRRLSA